ncbi:hypothetical protein HII12_004599 [Brettanomyces bruxellensis]|uniref:Zn(2)-C6 fungal-type domain-containing protein n=1 Tax=Dekkera bruxellensis TaxID=5007 RepID=A0A8H6B9Q9_DEKBR|nr:hypothetical protein HII12_004599 [Brettanomyces bruxellensis]
MVKLKGSRQPQQKPKPKRRRRNRVPISCTICRRRKVKCDKKKPQCTNCIKNGVAHLCHYLEPSWAKPLREEELKFPGARVTDYGTPLERENNQLKQKIKELEHQNMDLKQKVMVSQNAHRTNSLNASLNSLDNADLLDCVSNSNILFTAKRGSTYHFPIIYEISVFSWMFIVRNDSYLNDLWLKIINLRKHYEYYYSSKNAMADASHRLATDYSNYGTKLDKICDNSFPGNVDNKANTHTSKLKRFLDGTLSLAAKNMPKTENSARSNAMNNIIRSQNGIKNVVKSPAAHSLSEISDDESDLADEEKVCPLMIGDARDVFKEKLTRKNINALRSFADNSKQECDDVCYKTPPTVICSPKSPEPIKLPKDQESLKNNPSDSGKTRKVQKCPIKNEAASNSSFSDATVSFSSSLHGKEEFSKKRTFSEGSTSHRIKRLKKLSPSEVKGLNYNNTEEVLSIIEKYLPGRKVVWLLIDRFFEKLYLQMPYLDEESFRICMASIIGPRDLDVQRITIRNIGTHYCEEFLSVCLMLIIIRLSWLSLPSKISNNLSPEDKILMKPENLVTMVLVDMVKEVFSSAKLMGKPSLVIFQVGLYLKIYNILAPEDGFDVDDTFTDGGSNEGKRKKKKTGSLKSVNDLSGDLSYEAPSINSPNFMAMLVQLGRTIGLNRDPLNFRNFYSSVDPIANSRLFRKRHLWRKLWYGLLYLSIECNLSMGDYKKGLPIELDLDPTLGSVNKTWDSRLPGGVEQGVLEKAFYGVALEKEQIVVNNFRDSIAVYHLLYMAMSSLMRVDQPSSTRAIAKIMNKLLDLISEKSRLGLNTAFLLKRDDDEKLKSLNLRSRISLSDTRFGKSVRVYKLRLYLIIKSMLFALNYLLLINHEQKFNRLIADKSSTLTGIAKQKQYITTYFEGTLLLAVDNFNAFIQLLGNTSKNLSNCGSELITYPYLLILNHRSHEFLISLILRLQQNSPLIVDIIQQNGIDKDELLSRMFRYLKTFLEKLESLTGSYYYAWRLKKMVKFFYNILVHSKKLFGVDFNLVKDASGNNADERRNLISRDHQIQLQKSHELQQLQQSQDSPNVHPTVLKNGPTSAFEIAFGTSKLPPVTDYADTNVIPCRHYKQTFHRDMHLSNDKQQQPKISVQHSESQMRGEIQPHNSVGSDIQDPSSQNITHGLANGLQANPQMDDFFGDDFFYDFPDGDSGLLGDAFDTISYNGAPKLTIDNNSPSLGLYPAEASTRTNISGPLLSSTSGANMFVGNAYNSLNEIDFTNVDLNSQLDEVTSRENSNSGINDQFTDDNHLSGLSNLHLQFTDP